MAKLHGLAGRHAVIAICTFGVNGTVHMQFRDRRGRADSNVTHQGDVVLLIIAPELKRLVVETGTRHLNPELVVRHAASEHQLRIPTHAYDGAVPRAHL